MPRNENDEVRDGTRRPWICASALRISSARPSEKYSVPGVSLMFTNGSTATDLSSAAGVGSAAACGAGAPAVADRLTGVSSAARS